MSTTKKGDLFEDRVFDYIRQYVANGESFLNPQWCQFYQKRKYYSKDRESDIKVDVSVESYSEGADEWSLLLVLECKDLKDPVPVDDVEEFVAKLDQISGKNVKGILFSTSGFQKSALNYSRSKGIGLVRMLPDDQVQWVLRRAPAAINVKDRKKHYENQVLEGLTVSDYMGQSEFIFGCANDVKSASLTEIINEVIKDHATDLDRNAPIRRVKTLDRPLSIPFIGQEELESRTSRIREYFDSEDSKKNEIHLPSVCDYLASNHGVKFLFDQELGVDSSGKEILGKISIDPLNVYISKTLESNSHRWRYTVAHELGHIVLHRHINLASIIGTHFETEQNLSWSSNIYESKIIGRLEWQANAFASALLMPRDTLFLLVVGYLENMNVNNFSHGVIYLDDQQCNLQPFIEIVTKLSNEFNVSKEAVKYRLAQLRILNDQTKRIHISDAIGRSVIFQSMGESYNESSS